MDRRQFLAGSGAVALALAAPGARAAVEPTVLRIVNRTLDVRGKAAKAFGLLGPDGKPGLSLDAEAPFAVSLKSEIAEPTLVHWHGLTPPWPQDGVPDNPAPMLAPGAVRAYDFPLRESGTFWMHAHTMQEQALLAAPLIVRTAAERAADALDTTLFLHDFSFTPAEALLDTLRKRGGMAGMAGMGHGGGMGGMAGMGQDGGMAGMTMDANDVDYDAYLANDRTLDDPQVTRVAPGHAVRLRVINAAAATAFILDLGALAARLVAVDGQAVVPLAVSRVPIGMGQRVDLAFVMPRAGGAFPVLALREGARARTGIVFASPGAAVAKIADAGTTAAPRVDLAVERRLRALEAPPAATGPARRVDVTLGGDMKGYSWSVAGAEDLAVKRGERIEIAMRNMSPMMHPMHLHGHRFQVVGIDGRRLSGAMRDTVNVPPMARVAIAFEADNPGHWPFHCHNLYHMMSGMMGYVSYPGAA
ncbi:MAG: multicopper oxidase family protein [Hyphomicrobiales bacterium]|nr:multicopper oxidase family protein [Hyphomicrobiales bacterium]MDE2016898.1 multicopper oxidase family protein [Hyphomicrobiales bacterium]